MWLSFVSTSRSRPQSVLVVVRGKGLIAKHESADKFAKSGRFRRGSCQCRKDQSTNGTIPQTSETRKQRDDRVTAAAVSRPNRTVISTSTSPFLVLSSKPVRGRKHTQTTHNTDRHQAHAHMHALLPFSLKKHKHTQKRHKQSSNDKHPMAPAPDQGAIPCPSNAHCLLAYEQGFQPRLL